MLNSGAISWLDSRPTVAVRGDVRQRHLCLRCRQRRALYRYRGAVKADRSHTLCFQCYRALRDSVHARCMAHLIP